jgi:hypothetical protein
MSVLLRFSEKILAIFPWQPIRKNLAGRRRRHDTFQRASGTTAGVMPGGHRHANDHEEDGSEGSPGEAAVEPGADFMGLTSSPNLQLQPLWERPALVHRFSG